MSNRIILLIVFSSILFTSCDNLQGPKVQPKSAIPCDTVAVSYKAVIVPMFAKYNCTLSGCHGGTFEFVADSVKLDEYQYVRDVALNGRLYGAMAHDSANYAPMPLGKPKVTDCELAKVKAWINQGAKDN